MVIPRPPALETAMARERPETVRIGAEIMSGALALNMEERRAVSGDIFAGSDGIAIGSGRVMSFYVV